jgi:hypothetical protein
MADPLSALRSPAPGELGAAPGEPPACPPPARAPSCPGLSARLLLSDCARAFRDPVLHLTALLDLRARRFAAWQALARDALFVDSFFEIHGMPARPRRPSWALLLPLAEVLSRLLADGAAGGCRHPARLAALADACVEWCAAAPLGPAACLLRCAMLLLPLAPAGQLRARAQRLIARLDGADSPLLRVALAFVLRLRPPVFPPHRAVRAIAAREMRSIADIEIVAELADEQSALIALGYLGSAAFASKLWHRACVDAMRRVVVRFAWRADVQALFEKFVARAFLFVSKGSSRSCAREILFCESLSAMLTLRIPWVEHCIAACAASVVAAPAFFRSFFAVAAGDEDEALFPGGLERAGPVGEEMEPGNSPTANKWKSPVRLRPGTSLIKKPAPLRPLRPLASAIFVPSV